jgi:hypothetical protein
LDGARITDVRVIERPAAARFFNVLQNAFCRYLTPVVVDADMPAGAAERIAQGTADPA